VQRRSLPKSLSQPASVALAGRAFRAENALGSPADAGIP
jgi:hypothetical protein